MGSLTGMTTASRSGVVLGSKCVYYPQYSCCCHDNGHKCSDSRCVRACVCLPYGLHVVALSTVNVYVLSVAADSDANGTEETPHNA